MLSTSLLITVVIVAVTLLINVLAVRQVARHRTVDGLSMSTIAMGLSNTSIWLAYGAMTGQPAQVIANGGAALGKVFILTTAHRTNALDTRRTIALLAGCAAIVGGAGALWGSTALAVVVSTFVFISGAPQVVAAWRRPGGLGVSVPALSIGTLVSLGWALEGAFHHDFWVISTSIYCAALNVFVVARAVQARRSSVKTVDPAPESAEPTLVPAAA